MISGIDFRTLVEIVFKFKRRAALVFFGCVALAAAASILLPAQYRSTNSMLVKIGRELVYRPDIGSSNVPLPVVDKDQVIASNIAIMNSRSALETVVNRVGLARLYPDLAGGREPETGIKAEIGKAIRSAKDWLGMPEEPAMQQAVRLLSRKLAIDVVKKTGIVNVTFQHPDPAVAADVANAVVAVFQSRVGDIYDTPNLAFEEGQVASMRAELDRSEARLNAYRRTHGAFALDSQMQLLLKQRVDMDARIKDLGAQVVQLGSLTTTLAAQIAAAPKTVSLYSETDRYRAVDDAAGQLAQLRIQERQLATRFGNDYPQLVEVRNQIRAAQSIASSQNGAPGVKVRTGLNDVRTAMEQSLLQNQAQLQATTSSRDAVVAQAKTLDDAIATLSASEPELVRLERDVTLRNAALQTSYTKLVEAQAVAGLNHEKPSSFSVIETATAPDLSDPARPLPLLYMALGVLAGLLGSAATVFLSFTMFRGFLTPRQAALALNRPILTVIDYDRRLKNWNPAMFVSGGGIGSSAMSGGLRTRSGVV